MTRATGVTASIKRGGVLLQIGDALRFVPASITVGIAAPPHVTPVPGAPAELRGVALYDGAIVPVVAVGTFAGPMLVCRHAGELVGIVGAKVLATGFFAVASDGPDLVLHDGRPAPSLELGALYARVQSGAHPGRWGGH